MIDKIKKFAQKVSNIDAQSIGLIIIIIVGISVTYSSAKIIQKNYILQEDITKLQQENNLQQQINSNQALKNEYYKTDAYLDIATRRYTNKVSDGERLYLVPKDVAMAYTKPVQQTDDSDSSSQPKFIQNWRKWVQFLSGKTPES